MVDESGVEKHEYTKQEVTQWDSTTFIAAQGQRALVGKVNMDVRSPDYYIETTEDSIKDTLSFIEYVDQMKVQ